MQIQTKCRAQVATLVPQWKWMPHDRSVARCGHQIEGQCHPGRTPPRERLCPNGPSVNQPHFVGHVNFRRIVLLLGEFWRFLEERKAHKSLTSLTWMRVELPQDMIRMGVTTIPVTSMRTASMIANDCSLMSTSTNPWVCLRSHP